jgi:hypothetical protein
VATAIITTVLAHTVGRAKAVPFGAGRLWVATRPTRVIAAIRAAGLLFAIGLAGLITAAPMTIGDPVWAGATRGAAAVVTTDLPYAATLLAGALEAIGVAAAGAAGPTAAVGAAVLAFTIGLAEALAVQTDVLGVGALTTEPAATIRATELADAIGRADIGALELVAIGLLGVLADAAQDAATIVATLLGRTRARHAAPVGADLAPVAEPAISTAAIGAAGLVGAFGFADAEAVRAGVVDAAAGPAEAAASVVAALPAFAGLGAIELAGPFIAKWLIGWTGTAVLTAGPRAADQALTGALHTLAVHAPGVVFEALSAIGPASIGAADLVLAIRYAIGIEPVFYVPASMDIGLVIVITSRSAG